MSIVASLASSSLWLFVNCAVFIMVKVVLVILVISAEQGNLHLMVFIVVMVVSVMISVVISLMRVAISVVVVTVVFST